MQIILASAKIMNASADVALPTVSEPAFKKEAELFALELGQLSAEELKEQLHCSLQLAMENKLRYQDFFNEEAKMPAILAYYGQAYKCLKAQTLKNDDFSFSIHHLWILSFLYGMLRPSDNIHPYRLEGKMSLEATEGKNMFAYWKPILTDMLIDSVKNDDGILVHLATEEYQHLFDWKRVKKELSVIQPHFMVSKGGTLKNVTVYAKSCRGAMTRFILQNRITKPEDLLAFEYEGFVYKEENKVLMGKNAKFNVGSALLWVLDA